MVSTDVPRQPVLVYSGGERSLYLQGRYGSSGLTPGVEGKKVIVQGFGNVGYYSAKFFQEGGAIIVGIGEYEGAIYNENGLDYEAVFNHRKSTGSILNFRCHQYGKRPAISWNNLVIS